MEMGDGWETRPQMGEHREVMTLREASEYLSVSPDTLCKYINERRIRAFKLGNRWRLKKDLLDHWMEEMSEQVLKLS